MTTDAAPKSDVRHRDAVTRLEGAFAELMAELRQFYAQAAETAAPGMLPATFRVLSVVERSGPVTVSGLVERLTADKGQMSRSVSILEDYGFVERTTDPADARVRLIATTPLGRERLRAAREPYDKKMTQILREWPVESIDALTDLLGALTSGSRPPEFPAR